MEDSLYIGPGQHAKSSAEQVRKIDPSSNTLEEQSQPRMRHGSVSV
ncbi:hypothetical protein NKH24_35050 [Mesorhizobium sp. M1300]